MVVRIFLSQLHLAQDAAERTTMVTTYLSLLESKSVLSEEDRKIFLAAIFRPTSDGIVKDDGIPPSMADLLTRPPR